VGAAVSSGAHLTALRRTAIGPYAVTGSVAPDSVSDPLPIEAAVGHLPRLDLVADEAAAASYGRPLGPAGLAGPYGVFGPDGRLIGVYEDDGPRSRPQVILAG
jgi:tRNA pseudouridine55 synthase